MSNLQIERQDRFSAELRFSGRIDEDVHTRARDFVADHYEDIGSWRFDITGLDRVISRGMGLLLELS